MQRILIFCLLLTSTIAVADEPKPPLAKKKKKVAQEPATPVFGGELKRFRFKMKGVFVDPEFSEAATRRMGDISGVIGAYPDYRTNSLFVIASPEAELAIRRSIAEWLVATQGGSAPLKAQRRQMLIARREVLREMAELDVLAVESDKSKAVQINARSKEFAENLATIERQIEVIERYMKRMKRDSKRDGLAKTP